MKFFQQCLKFRWILWKYHHIIGKKEKKEANLIKTDTSDLTKLIYDSQVWINVINKKNKQYGWQRFTLFYSKRYFKEAGNIRLHFYSC